MAEVNANSLPAKTELGANDSAIVVDQTSNAGALVDLDVLADKVLDRISSKTFANQVGGSSAATLLSQLSTLNTNFPAAWVQVPVTFNTDVCSANTYYVARQGRLVQFNFILTITDTVTSTTTLVRGMPKPIASLNLLGFNNAGNQGYKMLLDRGQGSLGYYYGNVPTALPGTTMVWGVYITDDI